MKVPTSIADLAPIAAVRRLRKVPSSSLIWHLATSLPSLAVSVRSCRKSGSLASLRKPLR